MSNIELPRCYILTKLHKGKTFYFGGEEGFTQHAGEALLLTEGEVTRWRMMYPETERREATFGREARNARRREAGLPVATMRGACGTK